MDTKKGAKKLIKSLDRWLTEMIGFNYFSEGISFLICPILTLSRPSKPWNRPSTATIVRFTVSSSFFSIISSMASIRIQEKSYVFICYFTNRNKAADCLELEYWSIGIQENYLWGVLTQSELTTHNCVKKYQGRD